VHIVLLGAPGAGKGTQAPILAEKIGGIHLSTGDMLRGAVRQGSPHGVSARDYMAEGLLVPDEIVLGMVMERLSRPDAARAFVLDGFPRNVAQARALDKALAGAGRRLDRVIHIAVPRDVLLERLLGRWTCSNCQAIYHEVNNPPRVPGVRDRCGGELRQRADDRSEAVQRRLQVYLDETAPLVEYYREQGTLREVDGNKPTECVTDSLVRVLQNEPDDAKI